MVDMASPYSFNLDRIDENRGILFKKKGMSDYEQVHFPFLYDAEAFNKIGRAHV